MEVPGPAVSINVLRVLGKWSCGIVLRGTTKASAAHNFLYCGELSVCQTLVTW